MSAPLSDLLHELSRPSAFPFAVERVDVVQTHISMVFLAGEFVYKVKKPVQLGFLDFSTLDKRLHFCEEEVRLNRRLAADVYLGVVSVTRGPHGLRFEGDGQAMEWAVKMRRLPEEATLEHRLRRDELEVAPIESLARKIAEFHARAERNPRIASFGSFDVVARNMRENFDQTRAHVGQTVTAAVWERVHVRTEEALAELRPLIEARAARGVPCDTHGDLRLDHVYLFPDRPAPDDMLIIDCIEFNERFRYADPVADMAFLVMDFAYHARRDLARALSKSYIQMAGDKEGNRLLALYSSYRSVVRAKVDGMSLGEKEIPEDRRARHLRDAKAHWLLALGEIEPPARKPCLLLIGGLPGSGKSTLARGLAESSEWQLLRSDVVRKELAGLRESERALQEHYGEAWSERTYGELLLRAELGLAQGQRVLIDANFRKASQRQPFVELARRWAAPAWFLACETSPETARRRLAGRRHDASDADPAVYDRIACEWESPGVEFRASWFAVDGEAAREAMREQAFGHLRSVDYA